MTDRKLRVFLCHASQDKPVVRELYQRLNAEGWIDPWLDEENLLPGQDWDLEIEKTVETADVVLVCLTNRSITKEGYIQKELRYVLDIALEKPEETIFVIPLRLEECDVPRRLRTFEYADYFPPGKRNVTYSRLMKSLQLRAKSIGLEVKKDAVEPAETDSEKVETKPVQFIPENFKAQKTSKLIVPSFKLQPSVCEVCQKPFRFFEQYATCDSCGAKYHKMCGCKIMDLRLNHTCKRCGKLIESEKFRLPAV